jgi:hypothetical protein
MDLMALVNSFDKGEINIARLNYIMFVIIANGEAKNLNKFRLISLIKCSFKIFEKTLNNRLVQICNKMLSAY